MKLTADRNMSTFRKAYEANRCRRRRIRERISPQTIKAWSREAKPTEVKSIEIDRRGARLVLPFDSVPGEHIRVSLANSLGQYHTTRARIVWTQKLPNSTHVIAGLAFDTIVTQAA
jgi:PilZ domain